jgi:hypothetical protein
MSSPFRQPIPCPSADVADDAPQLLVVALADAALLAIDRALDSAHPILATRFARSPPVLFTSERIAAQIRDLAGHLAVRLRDYAEAVHWDSEDIDEDPLDSF